MRNYRTVIKQNNLLIGREPKQSSETPIILIEKRTKFNFTVDAKSFTSTIDGYIIFLGAYRNNDLFLLNGFTILRSETMVNSIDGIEQHTCIAYKKVIKNEKINFTPSQRFGGTIYETKQDVSKFKVTQTYGTNNKLYPAVIFPKPTYNATTFAIVSQIVNHYSLFSKDTYSNVIVDRDNDYRIITHVASLTVNDFSDAPTYRYTEKDANMEHTTLKLLQFILYL